MSNSIKTVETRFDLFGKTLCATISSLSDKPSSHTFITLHGWMDNSASFDFLIHHLLADFGLSIEVISLDLMGHGNSDHLVGLGAYNIWQDIADVIAIADERKLERFSLIGHSRGAMIATLLAGTFADRVDMLFAIESIIPAYSRSQDAPANLAESVSEQLKICRKKQHFYDTFDKAVLARERGYIALNKLDAQTLAKRGVKKNKFGYYWNLAPLLMAPSELKLTLEQIQAFFDAIKADITLYIASDGLVLKNKALTHWLSLQENIDKQTFVGEHHFHMSKNAFEIAQSIANKVEHKKI